jgi:soluble lytic murein transglycosylase-like protein
MLTPVTRVLYAAALLTALSSLPASSMSDENWGSTARLTLDTHTSKHLIERLIAGHAAKLQIPVDLALAVAFVESSFDPTAIGGVGEIGLMQVRLSTARQLGFRGTAEQLAEPDTNARYGATYLAEAWRLSDQRVCEALMRYRAGWGETVMSFKSAVYCGRALQYLNSTGSFLAKGVAVPPSATLTAVSLGTPRGRVAVARAGGVIARPGALRTARAGFIAAPGTWSKIVARKTGSLPL